MIDCVTWKTLEDIHQYYNPLGNKHTLLVDEFLIWTRQRGSFYWVWDGAIELSNGKEDPKEIIKRVPFGLESEYRDLLRKEWIVFLNQPNYKSRILEEYKEVVNLPF